MSDKNKEEEKFRGDAKIMVDTLFNKKIFRDDLTRDNLKALEDWIQFTMSSRLDSEQRIELLMKKINK